MTRGARWAYSAPEPITDLPWFRADEVVIQVREVPPLVVSITCVGDALLQFGRQIAETARRMGEAFKGVRWPGGAAR